MSKTTIEINGDPSGFKDAAKSVNKEFGNISKGAQQSAKQSTSAFTVFLGTFSALALQKAFSVAANGFRSIVRGAGDAIQSAGQLEASINTLENALVSTGKFTREASDEIQEFTFGLQSVSKFAGDAITKNAGLIQSLANLEKDGLKRATQAAVDLASAQGIGLDQASKTLGQALSGNVNALRRFGIQLDVTGDKQKDVENALAALEDRFGGSGLRAVQTFEGAQAQLANTQGDLSAAFGRIITDSPAVTGAISGVNKIFEQLIEVVNNNRDTLIQYVDSGIMMLVNGFGFISTGAGFVIDSISAINTAFQGARVIIAELAKVYISAWDGILQGAQAVAGFFGKDSDLVNNARQEIGVVKEILSDFQDDVIDDAVAFKRSQDSKKKAIQDFVQTAQDTLKSSIDAQKEITQEELDLEREKQSELNAIRRDAKEEEKEISEQDIERFIEQERERLDFIRDILGQEEALREEARARELAGRGDFNAAAANLSAAEVKARRADIFAIQKFEELSQRERVANLQSTLGKIASLQQSSSSELFAIGKAAAIGTATIDGFQAVQKALASAPPPLNFALATAVGAATAANIANIASTPRPTGAFNGALVEGGSQLRDTQPFMLSRGELVAPRKSFDEVVEGTARQRGFTKQGEGGAKTVNVNIDTLISQDEFVNDLIEKIREKILFENADIGVAS